MLTTLPQGHPVKGQCRKVTPGSPEPAHSLITSQQPWAGGELELEGHVLILAQEADGVLESQPSSPLKPHICQEREQQSPPHPPVTFGAMTAPTQEDRAG